MQQDEQPVSMQIDMTMTDTAFGSNVLPLPNAHLQRHPTTSIEFVRFTEEPLAVDNGSGKRFSFIDDLEVTPHYTSDFRPSLQKKEAFQNAQNIQFSPIRHENSTPKATHPASLVPRAISFVDFAQLCSEAPSLAPKVD